MEIALYHKDPDITVAKLGHGLDQVRDVISSIDEIQKTTEVDKHTQTLKMRCRTCNKLLNISIAKIPCVSRTTFYCKECHTKRADAKVSETN